MTPAISRKLSDLFRVEIVAPVAMARVGQQLGVRLGEIGDGGVGRLAFGAERMHAANRQVVAAEEGGVGLGVERVPGDRVGDARRLDVALRVVFHVRDLEQLDLRMLAALERDVDHTADLGRLDGFHHVRVLRRPIATGDGADEQELVDAGKGVDHRFEVEVVALEHLDAVVGEALRLLQLTGQHGDRGGCARHSVSTELSTADRSISRRSTSQVSLSQASRPARGSESHAERKRFGASG